MHLPILHWPGDALATPDLLAPLPHCLAVCLRGVLPRVTCDTFIQGVYRGRDHWNRDFGGEQFSLGRAWYTHLEQGKSHEYFAHARASDEDVERFAPGLQALVCAHLTSLLGAPAQPRRAWCGPGLHIFPASEWVARQGGVIHADIEGLPTAHVAARAPALTAVLMLQPPEQGGGLRLWDALHHEDDALDPDDVRDLPHLTHDYEPGDLLVIDSYRLHQIQPFAGSRDRISLTAHAAPLRPGAWDVWF